MSDAQKLHPIEVPSLRKRQFNRKLQISYVEQTPMLGVLTIVDERGRPTQYKCQETAATETDGRTFTLTKVGGEEYNCVVNYYLSDCSCQCVAGTRNKPCKHILALRHLILEGVLHEHGKKEAAQGSDAIQNLGGDSVGTNVS